MVYAIDTREQAQARAAELLVEYPEGPPMRADKTFSRFSVEPYSQGDRAPVWCIVVKWRYRPTAERPDLNKQEFGGAAIWFEFGKPSIWNN